MTELVPDQNLRTYSAIYSIEVALRELVIERFRQLDGYGWYKQRLPSDILAKYKEGRKRERNTPWTTFVHHDPLYYVDFSELARIMQTGKNWSDAFQRDFGRKDIFVASLQSLEEIRNKVAHNRKCTSADVRTVEAFFNGLNTALGENRMKELIMRCSNADDGESMLRALREEGRSCFENCTNCKALPERSVWTNAKRGNLLPILAISFDVVSIEAYHSLLDEYSSIPPHWPGYSVERWNREKHLDEAFHLADAVINAMIEETRS
jgi:hypothetical protein